MDVVATQEDGELVLCCRCAFDNEVGLGGTGGERELEEGGGVEGVLDGGVDFVAQFVGEGRLEGGCEVDESGDCVRMGFVVGQES